MAGMKFVPLIAGTASATKQDVSDATVQLITALGEEIDELKQKIDLLQAVVDEFVKQSTDVPM